jgi:hypothetical protein
VSVHIAGHADGGVPEQVGYGFDGLIARYPNAIIKITGFPFGS